MMEGMQCSSHALEIFLVQKALSPPQSNLRLGKRFIKSLTHELHADGAARQKCRGKGEADSHSLPEG
jgi:hypothetical protein